MLKNVSNVSGNVLNWGEVRLQNCPILIKVEYKGFHICPATVSYTHLDVYKRQVYDLIVFPVTLFFINQKTAKRGLVNNFPAAMMFVFVFRQ